MLHVMIDLYHCDTALLQNEAFLHRVLDDYPDFIGMDKVTPVVLRDIKTSDPLDDGFSGFVIIATSHVSLLISRCEKSLLQPIQRLSLSLRQYFIPLLSLASLS